jgi:hypothetical protein
MLDEELARTRVKEAIQKGLLAQHNSRSLGKRRRLVSASLRSALCELLIIYSWWLRRLSRAAHRVSSNRLASGSQGGPDSATTTRELAGRWCGD